MLDTGLEDLARHVLRDLGRLGQRPALGWLGSRSVRGRGTPWSVTDDPGIGLELLIGSAKRHHEDAVRSEIPSD